VGLSSQRTKCGGESNYHCATTPEEHALDTLPEATGGGVKLNTSCMEAIIEGVLKMFKGKEQQIFQFLGVTLG
jgi:hypothetical protein